MSEELKRCPFCGVTPVIYEGRYGFWIKCSNPNCIAEVITIDFDGQEEAIAAWNQRKGEAE